MSSTNNFPFIQQQIIRVFFSSYLLFGNIGNILNCLVFSRKSLRGSSCSIYFIALSITNLLVLDYAVVVRFYSNENVNPNTYSLIYCKLNVYITHVLLMISRSYIIFICIDRFCMCSPSASIRRFSTRHIAQRVVIIIPFVWLTLAIHIPFFTTIQSGSCTMISGYSIIYSIYSVCVTGIMPPMIMIIFTFLTYRTMRKIRARIIPTTSTMQVRIQKRDQQLYGVSICQVIVYVLSSSLLPATQLYFSFIRKGSPQTIMEFIFNLVGTTLLLYLNNSATFYIYICMSSSFRKEFKKFILTYCLHRSIVDQSSTNPGQKNGNTLTGRNFTM